MIRRAFAATLGTKAGRRAVASIGGSAAVATTRGVRSLVEFVRPDVNKPRRTTAMGIAMGVLAAFFMGNLYIGLAVLGGYLIVSGAQRVRLNARRVEGLDDVDETTHTLAPAPPGARPLDVDASAHRHEIGGSL